MTTAKNIFEPSTSTDLVQRAMDAFSAVRQFQQDWKDFGSDRVHLYFDNVDGNWIEEFNKDPANTGSLPAPYGNIEGSAY